MTSVDLLAIAFWPLLALATLSFVFVRGRLKAHAGHQLLLDVAAAASCLAIIFAYRIFGDLSALFLIDFQIFYVVLGSALVSLAAIPWKRKLGIGTKAAGVCVAVLGFGAISLGIWQLHGDFLLPRRSIQGSVDTLYTAQSARSSTHYYVQLNGQIYRTTFDLFTILRVGERIQAEVGRGSGYIFRFERLAAK